MTPDDVPEVAGDEAGDEADGLAAALDVVGQRWALLIVRALLGGAARYGDLQRELGAPTNILATRLRELQAAGVLYRVPLAHNARAYALTERGAGLREAVEALERWGRAGRGAPGVAGGSGPRPAP